MDTLNALTAPVPAAPTKSQIVATLSVTFARGVVKWGCAFLALHGVTVSGSNSEIAIGIVGGVITEGVSLWSAYGKEMAVAGLTILRAKVLNAAAKAQVNPASAPAAIATVAAHVQATAPAAAPAP